MTDERDPQDLAEALDSDKISGGDDPDIEPEYPPDHPLGVDEYGLTSAEESIDEPLEERVTRETADPLAEELGEARDGSMAAEPPDLDGDPDLSAEEAAMHVARDPEAG